MTEPDPAPFLADGEARYRLILQKARDYAIFATDRDGNIVDWGEGAEAVFGYAPGEMVGRNAAILYTAEDRASGAPEQELAAAREEGSAPDVRWHVRKGGGRVFIEGSTSPLRDVSGRLEGFLKIGQDATARRAGEERQRLLLSELQHRVRNSLAVIRSIVRRTADNSDGAEALASHLQGRIDAFARVQASVIRRPEAGVDLMSIVQDELVAHAVHEGDRLSINGPEVRLEPKAAEAISLAIHELATNAVEHGALAVGSGRIDVEWSLSGDARLDFSWQESGLEPRLDESTKEGFGFELLRRGLPYELDAETCVAFNPDGICFTLSAPLTAAIRSVSD